MRILADMMKTGFFKLMNFYIFRYSAGLIY